MIGAQPGSSTQKAKRTNLNAHPQAMYSIQTSETSEAVMAEYNTSVASTLAQRHTTRRSPSAVFGATYTQRDPEPEVVITIERLLFA